MFYRMPKAIDTDVKYKDMSNDAKLLYMYLLDRSSLSQKNGYTDENGWVYVYFTRKTMAQRLKVSERTTVRLMRELRELALVSYGSKEGGLSPKLYVKNLMSDKPKTDKKQQAPEPEIDEWELELLKAMAAD